MIRFVVDVVVLGSGTPNPDPGRAGSAVAICDDDAAYLRDVRRGGFDSHTIVARDLTRIQVTAPD
jgi:hypothetical protein